MGWDGLDNCTFRFKEWWLKLGMAKHMKGMKERQELTALIMWSIWKERNNKIFKNEMVPGNVIV